MNRRTVVIRGALSLGVCGALIAALAISLSGDSGLSTANAQTYDPNSGDWASREFLFVPVSPLPTEADVTKPGTVTYESAEPVVFYTNGDPGLAGHRDGKFFVYWADGWLPYPQLSERPEVRAQAAALQVLNPTTNFSAITYDAGFYDEAGVWKSVKYVSTDGTECFSFLPFAGSVAKVEDFACCTSVMHNIRWRMTVSWTAPLNGLSELPSSIAGMIKWYPESEPN